MEIVIEKPLVTIFVFTYNQEQFIKETLDSIISQDYENYEIVVSDDCSSDGTYDIIKDFVASYKGKIKITVNQNHSNMGIAAHYSYVLSNLVNGEYCIGIAGDDVCLPETISTAIQKIREYDLDSLSFNVNLIDAQSKKFGTLYQNDGGDIEIYGIKDYLNDTIKSTGSCRIFKYDIFKKFGPLSDDCQTEDSTTLLRTILYGKVGFCKIPNHNYRIHGNNISGKHSLMTKFNPEKMHSQYRRDLDFAYLSGMISKVDFDNFIDFFEHKLKFEMAQRKVYNKIGTIKRVICAIQFLFKKGYSIKDIRRLMAVAMAK